MRKRSAASLFVGGLSVACSLIGEARAFDCVELKCSEMTTCAEAHYKLTVCGHTKRDADHDGIPCEDLCGKDLQTYLARTEAQMPKTPPPNSPSLGLLAPAKIESPADSSPSPDFTCAGKRRCAEMISCDEAKFYLKSCGQFQLDKDRDGIPCNSICR